MESGEANSLEGVLFCFLNNGKSGAKGNDSLEKENFILCWRARRSPGATSLGERGWHLTHRWR